MLTSSKQQLMKPADTNMDKVWTEAMAKCLGSYKPFEQLCQHG